MQAQMGLLSEQCGIQHAIDVWEIWTTISIMWLGT